MKPTIVLLELTNQSYELLANIYTQAGYQVYSCRQLADISDYLTGHFVEFLVVNANLPHPSLLKGLKTVLAKHPLPIVMFTKSSDKSLSAEAVRCGVTTLIVDGFNVNRLHHIMDIAKARFEEQQRLNGDLNKLKVQLAERKAIDVAKDILMKRRAIDEAAALGLIRKMAVDRKQHLAQVAKDIIDVNKLAI